jgi:hypothetical protein
MTERKIRRLGRKHLERGIYIDFEGHKGLPPKIIGVLTGKQFRQYTLDDALAGAAEYSGIEHTDIRTMAAALFRQAQAENRYLVAWSEHELQMIREFASLDVSSRYYNAKYGAKRWCRRRHPEALGDGASLELFMQLTGFRAAAHLGKGNAGGRLRYVLNQLQRRGEFSRLTRVAKAKWTRLLRYNEQDCRALRHVALATWEAA